MKVQMSSKEKQAVLCARKFSDWAQAIASKDSYLQGFLDAKNEILKIIPEATDSKMILRLGALKILINSIGENEEQMIFENGEHQLSSQRAKAIGVDLKLEGAE